MTLVLLNTTLKCKDFVDYHYKRYVSFNITTIPNESLQLIENKTAKRYTKENVLEHYKQIENFILR
ncbi:hypothetical protein JCM16307_23330 [Thermococcus prieurii]